MRITIDLNVIVEVLLAREDREVCEKILTLCKRGRMDGRLPSHAIPTIYYIARRKFGHDKALVAIEELNIDLTVT
ncbi:MAG: PIN domain-containing protein, partial [Candidatus Kapaibacterium sp.]